MNPDDELIKAALMEDEEDLKEKEEKSTPEETTETKADAPEQPEETDSEEAEEDDELEAEEQETEPEADKPTRKERREAKKQAWLENVRREQPEQTQQEQAPQQIQQQPQQEQYQPIDYRQVEELNEQDLERDRATYAEIQRRQGIQEGQARANYIAEQDKFWQGVGYESKVLAYDPEFKFLDENNPDTFDPDLAADLNEKYLAFVGHNPTNNTVQRTDISYEKFVRNEVAERKAWAERLAAESTANLAETKANTGLRPGGNRTSGIGKLKPGDISKMSDEQLAKYEDEIDRQILSAWN